MQLTLDFTSAPQREQKPIIQNDAWLHVSGIVRAIGFTSAVQVSSNLNDALQPRQNELGGDYDQRLYDALWVAHFQLSLDQSQTVTFNFIFQWKDWKTEDAPEVSLRVRVEAQKQVVLLGFLEEF